MSACPLCHEELTAELTRLKELVRDFDKALDIEEIIAILARPEVQEILEEE